LERLPPVIEDTETVAELSLLHKTSVAVVKTLISGADEATTTSSSVTQPLPSLITI